MAVQEIGCCGAYCATCKAYLNPCKGCKTGYGEGGRDLAKARCAIKRCCMTKGFATCADCVEAAACEPLQAFYGHTGYKYKKYKQAIETIRSNGYDAFLAVADGWSNACGRYPNESKE